MASTISRAPLFLILLLSFAVPSRGISPPLTEWRTLFSLSHVLMERVANLRAARGDSSGAERARKIAYSLGSGYRFWSGIGSMSWDYIRNYAWRNFVSQGPPAEIHRAVSDLNKLMASLTDFARRESPQDRARWLSQNYQHVLGVSVSILKRFLLVFTRSGPLREAVWVLTQEVEEGDLIRDCLELGGNDMRGLIQVVKDILTSHYFGETVNDRDL